MIEVPPPPRVRKRGLANNRELEDEIAADPFDDSRWSVLDDWLLENGDPRAEIVRVEQTHDAAQIDHAYRRLHRTLLGPRHRTLAKHLLDCDRRSGYVLSLVVVDDDRDLLGEILAAPAMALVRDLTIAPRRVTLIDDLLGRVAAARCGRSIRVVKIATEQLFSAACLAPLRVERLAIEPRFASTLAYDPALAHVRELVIAPRDRIVFENLLGDGAFPELRGLELVWHDRMLAWTADDLGPLCSGRAAPRLERLAIRLPRRALALARELRRAIEQSSLRARLASLEIDPRTVD